jgi:hypothetical protein
METQKKKLFAVAVEKVVRDAQGRLIWVPDGITYVHGIDTANARFEYRKTDPKCRTRIVACGPVVGYYALDKEGKHLTV